MSVWFYVFSTLAVFIFSGLLAMAGLGAAFLFVPLFYYMGMPLAEATPAKNPSAIQSKSALV